MKRWVRTFSGLMLAVVLPGCGGSSNNNNPTPVVTPTPAPRPQVLLQVSGGVPGEIVGVVSPINTTSVGSFELTLDWTFARNNLDIALARGSCNTEDDLLSGRCAFIAATNNPATKPERLQVPPQPAGTYYVLVANFSAEDESVAIQVVFTPSSASDGVVGSLATRPVDLGHWRALRLRPRS